MSGDRFIDPEYTDHHHTVWTCGVCGFENSCIDGECQNIDCAPPNINGSSNV